MAGTREDAILVVELAKYTAILGLVDATGTIFGDEFDRSAPISVTSPCAWCSASTRRSPRS
jgi:hypothetical protein